jgi:hypothetical protein
MWPQIIFYDLRLQSIVIALLFFLICKCFGFLCFELGFLCCCKWINFWITKNDNNWSKHINIMKQRGTWMCSTWSSTKKLILSTCSRPIHCCPIASEWVGVESYHWFSKSNIFCDKSHANIYTLSERSSCCILHWRHSE